MHQRPVSELPLAGEIMLHPSPNRPGYWAYHLTPDGTLREIELSREEWHIQQTKEMAAKNEAVRRLNEHPLNQAALALLRRAGTRPQSGGALQWMHLLSLASLALPDYDSSSENEGTWIKLADWTWSVSSMRAALATIEGGLEPDELLGMSLRDAGLYILGELGINHT